MPPSTSISGSAMTTRLAAPMPRYFAVSRTTEIDTPSRLRAAAKTCSTVMRDRSPSTASWTRD